MTTVVGSGRGGGGVGTFGFFFSFFFSKSLLVFFPVCAFHGHFVRFPWQHYFFFFLKKEDFFNDYSSKTTEAVGL